jgi:formylglycine-generating enzyme required for sulfatase activity
MTKRARHVLSVLLIGITLLSACNLPAADSPGEPNQPPAETEPPVLTEVPIQPTEIPTLITVPDLGGAPMEVGSKIQYVDGSILVAVPGGKFIMGHGGEDNPEHEVTVSDFWMYRAKVTNSQFGLCVAMGKCAPPNTEKNSDYGDPLKANHPVTGVAYDQAASYCSFVNGRLPTEAEWEKAARGPDGNIYPWGDATPDCELANYGTCEFKTTSVIEHPEGQSYYEALDMAGNTYEWVADWYAKNYYNESPTEDPLGPDLGNTRSVRSSGFNSPAYETEAARRFAFNPIFQLSDLGFRCVVEDPTYFAPMCTALLVYGDDAGSGAPSGGGAPSEVCPNVDIVQNPYCNGLLPVTNIELIGPSDASFDPDGCVPTGNPNQYACQPPGGTISVKADCQQSLPGDPVCPMGFTQQGNQCISQGGAGACLPGYNYDPNLQCCTATPGQDSTVPLPQCPIGTYYVPGQNVCAPYPAKGIVSVVESVGFLNCIPDPTKTPGEPGEVCPGVVCQSYEKLCTNTCSCIYQYSPCP